jgi:hypothetical protein
MNAVPVQFCPECGQRVLEGSIDAHRLCIAWGIRMNKYRGEADWVAACIKNGERVVQIIGPL